MHVKTFCTFCLLKSFGSLGNSFDMLDQYTDSQSLETLHACSTKMANNAISNIFIDCVFLCIYSITFSITFFSLNIFDKTQKYVNPSA